MTVCPSCPPSARLGTKRVQAQHIARATRDIWDVWNRGQNGSRSPNPGFSALSRGSSGVRPDSSMRMLSVIRWRLNRRLRTGRMLRRRHRLDNRGLRGNGLPPYPSAHSPSSKWCSHRGCDLSRSCNGMVHPTVNWAIFTAYNVVARTCWYH